MDYGFNKALGSRAVGEWYVKLITDVADEPLTLADETIHSRLNLGSPVDPGEQAYVESLFTSARKAVESIIHRPIGSQEFELGMSSFPCLWVLEFPKSPLISIGTIKYTKADGTVITWYDSTASPVIDPGSFVIETGCDPGSLFMKSTQNWPLDNLMNGFPVKIRFIAGIDPVPDDLLQYLRLVFGFFYENRELATDAGTVRENLPNAESWLRTNYGYEAFA